MFLQGEMARSERSVAVLHPQHPYRAGTEPTSVALSGGWERGAAWGRMGSVHSPRPRQDTRSPDLPRFLKDREPLEQQLDIAPCSLTQLIAQRTPLVLCGRKGGTHSGGHQCREGQSTAALSSEP